MKPRTLILGIGNILMTDEGVGAEVVRRLEAALEPDEAIAFMDGGTLSFTLAGPIGESQRLIVVDAAALSDAPGSLRLFEDEAMDRQLRTQARSVHEVSLSDLMDMARLSDSLPERRALIGIEPGVIDWGERLTPEVEAAVPLAMRLAMDLLARWDAEWTAGSPVRESPT
ncbi:HyaD/HybD family hydrogenase maturation endopeptidase [Thiocystis violacea]|uniref:HyaD/HybD family hydrogenase maturation endopeptidase n=1 Tax=Thiocystis violacea TaxID=13725 RepID=UPI001906BE13|nr:HyaD/HybD family hydrogenase maturation endopeptidase [Thiocystis violacea]MBK1719516.1 peptidase M52 [Thiocystis violacea]